MRYGKIAAAFGLAAGLVAGQGAAEAAANPKEAIVIIKCTVIDVLAKGTKIPKCKDINNTKEGWLNGHLDWYSGGQFVYSEQGPFYSERHDERGEVLVFVDGN